MARQTQSNSIQLSTQSFFNNLTVGERIPHLGYIDSLALNQPDSLQTL